MERWTTHDGVELRIQDPEEVDLFLRAKGLYESKAAMDVIANLYLDKDCILYQRHSRAEIVKLDVYRAIKDMAKRRGLAAGLLVDRPGQRLSLDSFEVSRVKN